MKFRLLISVMLLSLVFAFQAPVYSQALTGNKIIGPGGDYATLTAAIADLNSKGASGTVTFLINADLTETGAHEITTTTLNGTNKLVIKPNTGKTPTVTFTALTTSGNGGNAGIAVSGSSANVGYITIDGSNTAGGTTRDMTFALSDATAGRYLLRFNGETDNITIQNLKLLAAATMSTTASSSRTYGVYAVASSTAAADNFTVTNCQIGTGTGTFYYGIYKPDGGTVPYGTGLTVSKNNIFAQHKGMSIWGCDGVSNINDNSVSIIGHPTGAYVQNSINGIYTETWKGSLNIFNNKVVSLKAKAVTQTAAKPMYGILIYYATGTGVTGQTANVYNNFISDFTYTGDASTLTTYPSEIDGIAVDATDQIVNVYFNSVFINADGITTNPCSGIRVYDDAGLSANIKNNIIVNAVNTDKAYAIYYDTIAYNTIKSSDYNDLYVIGANANVGYYNRVKCKTLEDWRSKSAKDANSISINPANPFGAAGQLKSISDLHWVSKPAASFAGIPIDGFTKDIDGDIRNAAKPYMGADEGASLTGINNKENLAPAGFVLNQNYPNPFNPSTTIQYSLPTASYVEIVVTNSIGQQVRTLVKGVKPSGVHEIKFTAGNLPSGIYFCSINAKSADGTKAYMNVNKMILMK